MSTILARPSAAPQRRSVLAWWHLTSLDAPTVALLWTVLLGWRAGINLPAAVALSVAVWMLYVIDRLLDARSGGTDLQERHHFHRLYRNTFFVLLFCTAPLLTILTLAVDAPTRHAWLLLALPLALYLLLIHATRIRLPKELVVAIFFSAACILPSGVKDNAANILPAAILFGLLCWSNCIAIARWENNEQTKQTHSLTRWAARHLPELCEVVIALACFAGLTQHIPAAAFCCVTSATGFLVLDKYQDCLPPVTLRALADASMLSPLLLLPVVAEQGRIATRLLTLSLPSLHTVLVMVQH